MECPGCRLISPTASGKCDCGWNFETRRIESQVGAPETLARHQRRIRNLTWLSLVLIGGPGLWLRQEHVSSAVALCLILPFLVPTCLALLRLTADAASARALASAATMSATLGVYAPLIAILGVYSRPPLWGRLWLWQWGFILLTATYWVLYWSTRRALKAGWPREARGFLPAMGLGIACFLTGALFFSWTLQQWARPSSHEIFTSTLLRAMGKAVTAYAESGRCGYPHSLAALPPPPAGANAYEAELAEKFKEGSSFLKTDYRFEYRPGPRAKDPAPGCVPGAESWVMSARPLIWDVSGRTSFYMDSSGAIRYTSEDRPATVTDPTLPR